MILNLQPKKDVPTLWCVRLGTAHSTCQCLQLPNEGSHPVSLTGHREASPGWRCSPRQQAPHLGTGTGHNMGPWVGLCLQGSWKGKDVLWGVKVSLGLGRWPWNGAAGRIQHTSGNSWCTKVRGKTNKTESKQTNKTEITKLLHGLSSYDGNRMDVLNCHLSNSNLSGFLFQVWQAAQNCIQTTCPMSHTVLSTKAASCLIYSTHRKRPNNLEVLQSCSVQNWFEVRRLVIVAWWVPTLAFFCWYGFSIFFFCFVLFLKKKTDHWQQLSMRKRVRA